MKRFKAALLALFICVYGYAQTPFDLTGVKSYYPVVEINSDRIDAKYKHILLDMIKKSSKELSIDTDNFSSRSLAFLVSYIGVGNELAIKLELLLGETMTRLDTDEEVFVVSYMSGRIFVPQDEEELVDNAEELLENFAAQYKEDNL